MNIWSNAVITNLGLALQAKLIAGNTLAITKVQIGAGYVSPGLLMQQTAVTDPKKTMTMVSSITYPEDGKCAIKINIDNDDVTTGYTAMQVGFYATDPDLGEILYFIAQAENGTGTIVPSDTEMPGYSAEWTFYFQYGQADNVTVVVDPSGTVTQDYVDSTFVKKAGDTMTGNLVIDGGTNQNHAIVKRQIGDDEYLTSLSIADTGYASIPLYKGEDPVGFLGIDAQGLQVGTGGNRAAEVEMNPFTSGTILEWANGCTKDTTKIITSFVPSDSPTSGNPAIVELIGAGNQKTVRVTPYNGADKSIYMRHIANNAWSGEWYAVGAVARETATDLHEISECTIVQCYDNTLNTPYKEGLTNAAHGVCIVSATGNFRSLVYIATSGSRPLYYQACINGNWGPWTTTAIVATFPSNTIYVGPTGNDTTGKGTSTAPYASLTKALSVIPKDLGGQTIKISIASGTYLEEGPNINDFFGGTLYIEGNSDNPPVFNNRINCNNCQCRLSIKSIYTKAPVDWSGFGFSRCTMVELNDCKVDATTTGKGFGIYSSFLSTVYAHNCEINNCQYGLSSVWGRLYTSTITGTGNTYGAHAGYGGQIGVAGTVPGYTTAQYVTYSGGRIYAAGQVNVPWY